MCLCVSPGDRTNVAGSDLSDLLPEEIEAEVKLAAEISMGTEVSEQDIGNIRHLCDQVNLSSIITRSHQHYLFLYFTVECWRAQVTVVMMTTFVFNLKQIMWVFSHYLI